MGLDLEEDRKRKVIELSLRAGKKRQSTQTGFVHHCYESEEEQHDTIPLFENFCFALSLLRSRQSENMLEGKALLCKLFKLEQEGNFPVYLHEFPLCKDKLLGIKLLPVLHAVLHDFHLILEDTLHDQLQGVIQRIVSNSSQDLPARYALYLKAYEDPQNLPEYTPTHPEQVADVLIAYHMAKCRGTTHCLDPVVAAWHPRLGTFKGPQEQEGLEPKPTLLDLFMGHMFHTYSERALQDHPIHLRASLVYPLEGGRLEDSEDIYPHISTHARQPFTLYWGSPAQLHSLVCDPKEMQASVESKPHGVHILLAAKTPASLEGPIESAFFCDLAPTHALYVNGVKATTFELGDVVEIRSGLMRVSIVFSLQEGEGIFTGHLLRGNRPLQCAAKGLSRYKAFDWQIHVRTIKRSDTCSLCASISWNC